MATAKTITRNILYETHRSSGYPQGIRAVDRLWSHIEQAGPDDCWMWQGKCTHAGYGQLKVKIGPRQYELFMAHRLIYLLTHGESPDNLVVMHTCDEPGCCNPAHLRLGTDKDNQQDCITKGRKPRIIIAPEQRAIGFRNGKYTKPEATPRGERNGQAKLTTEAVKRILSDRTVSNRELAERFGVTSTRIAQIRRGIGWKHLDV